MIDFLWGLHKITILFSVCCWSIMLIICYTTLKKELKEKIEEYKGISKKGFPWKSLLLMLPFVICPVLNVLIAVTLIICHETFYEKVTNKVKEELNEEIAVVKLAQLESEKVKNEEENQN